MISSSARPRAAFCCGEQVEDLRLDGHVERRGRLVGDQQRRIVGQRHRDHHALPLAAGELVRERLQPVLGVGEAALVEQRDDVPPQLCAADRPVQRDRLGHLPPDPMQRIEAGHRFLEHHPRDAAAAAPQAARVGADHLVARQHDAAGADRARRQQLQQRERRQRLARSALADQRQRLAADRARTRPDRRQRVPRTRTPSCSTASRLMPAACADRSCRAPPRR